MQYYIYILASDRNGTLYIGVTNDLIRRVWEHRNAVLPSFTSAHHVHKLVYFEVGDDAHGAIQREKQLKRWKRSWKIELIEKMNPYWNDLYEQII